MCKFKTLGVSWPPKGWKEFEAIDQSYGQAIAKNPISATVKGMSYTIEPIPVINQDNQSYYIYHLRVEGWDYNIYNESCEYPILSFVIKEKIKDETDIVLHISDIKTQAQPLPVTKRSVQRVFMAALFIIRQIEKGIVLDFEKILKLYKVHPVQRKTYEERDYSPTHSLFCGLDLSFVENQIEILEQ